MTKNLKHHYLFTTSSFYLKCPGDRKIRNKNELSLKLPDNVKLSFLKTSDSQKLKSHSYCHESKYKQLSYTAPNIQNANSAQVANSQVVTVRGDCLSR